MPFKTSGKIPIDDNGYVPVVIVAGDLALGAVELKDASSDTRAVVGSDGLEVEIKKSVNIDIGNLPSDYAKESGGNIETIAGKDFSTSAKQDDIITALTTNYNTKITESGNYTYVAKAVIGSAQASAVWQAFRIDETSGMVILWADGNDNFDNVATDLTALSYS